MSVSLDGLRVVDLRAELEKRGLDKTGTKQVLLGRLQKAIEEAKEDKIELKAEKQEESVDKSTNGVDDKDLYNMSGEVLDFDTSLEIKKEHNMDSSVEEVKVTDKAPHAEDVSIADAKKSAVAEVAQPAAKHADDEEETADLKAELAMHDESLEEAKDELLAAADEEMADVKAFGADVIEDIDGDIDMKTDEAQNGGQEDGSAAVNATTTTTTSPTPAGRANGTSEKKTATTTTAATEAKDIKKESKNGKKDDGEVTSSASPSKIKDRLTNDQNRNLWITNISQTTRATELKQALSEHGKVIGAKVVINARHPAACCYGYVRMETVADADNCIAKLNNTELNGQIIRIEKVRPDHLNPNSKGKDAAKDGRDKPSQKTPVRAPTPAKDEVKKERKPVEAPPKDDAAARKDKPKSSEEKKAAIAATSSRDNKEKEAAKTVVVKERSREKERRRSRSDSREARVRATPTNVPYSRPPPPPPRRGEIPAVRKEKDILTFDKIKTERERERLREREREMRMRRREESERVKEIERRQRSEEARLERERQKLKEERERLERERAEVLALERERQKREREKIEEERLELQRAKMRIQEEERRAVKRPVPPAYRERSFEERKRPVVSAEGRHFADAPPPPRFDGPSSIKTRDPSPQIKKFSTSSSSSKDYKRLSYEKRESYPPKRDYDERTHSSAMSRSSGGGAPVPKYESSSSSSYQRDRDMRTGSDPRGNVRTSGSNMSSSVSSSTKYNSSENKVRYSDRERERSPHFSNSRSMRDDRERRVSDTKSSDIRSSRDHRYPEPKESVRYDRTSSSSSASWSQHKNFTPSNSSSSKPWNKDAWRSSEGGPSLAAERWSSNTSSSRPSIPFSSNPSMNLGPSCPPPPGINTYANDRFEYKSNMSNMRKY